MVLRRRVDDEVADDFVDRDGRALEPEALRLEAGVASPSRKAVDSGCSSSALRAHHRVGTGGPNFFIGRGTLPASIARTYLTAVSAFPAAKRLSEAKTGLPVASATSLA